MSILKSVAISGTIGKQVFASTQPVILKSAIIDAGPTSAGVAVIRDGNASGEIVLTIRASTNNSNPTPLCGVRFDKGMHVKVLGSGAAAYLELE